MRWRRLRRRSRSAGRRRCRPAGSDGRSVREVSTSPRPSGSARQPTHHSSLTPSISGIAQRRANHPTRLSEDSNCPGQIASGSSYFAAVHSASSDWASLVAQFCSPGRRRRRHPMRRVSFLPWRTRRRVVIRCGGRRRRFFVKPSRRRPAAWPRPTRRCTPRGRCVDGRFPTSVQRRWRREPVQTTSARNRSSGRRAG